MLATPVSEKPVCAYTVSLAATMHSLASFGVEALVYLHQGDCHVDDARNTIIRDFLETDCTDLFFLDADLGWRPHSVMRFLEVPGDIVAGVYCHRSPGETYPFHPGEGVRESNEHGLFEMHKVPTGFMRIRRNVVETLYESELTKGRKFWWNQEERAQRKPLCKVVERGFASELGLSGLGGSNSDYHSGDYVLCLKARAAGFKIWVDLENWFEHVGEQQFTGHLGNHLRKQQGVDHSAFADAVLALKSGDCSEEVFKRLNAFSPNAKAALPGKQLFEAYWMGRTAQGDILECGSGLSTLVLGEALKGTEFYVWALENDLEWWKVTSRWLQRYEIGNVNLVYAPIVPDDKNGDWYGYDYAPLPPAFDGVLIDGPWRQTAEREGVFKHLGERIAHARTWIVDDCGDPVQADMLARHAGDREVKYVIAAGGGSPHKTAIATTKQAQMVAAE